MSRTPEKENLKQSFENITSPTWRIFRIMSEFVEGFSFLADIEKSVTIFGSARLGVDNHYYQQARELSKRLAEQGYTIVTGGGPGIMQAGNQGACEGGGESVGLSVQVPWERGSNQYVQREIRFKYFFSRKVMLDFSAEAYIFFPGGLGTLDELFELLTLVQTGKIDHGAPVILIGQSFWEPMTRWLEEYLLNELHVINPEDLHLWTLTDDIEEAAKIVASGVQQQAQQRLAKKGRLHTTPDDKLRQATSPNPEEEL